MLFHLEQLIEKAGGNGVSFAVCMPPARRELQFDEAAVDYLEAAKAFIEGIAKSHDNVILLTDEYYFVTADQIKDSGNHLKMEESIIYTDIIAQKILDYQDTCRP